MDSGTVSFSIVGLGRAGRSLLGALAGSQWQCVGTYGRGDDLAAIAADVDVVILAVPDDAIASVAASIAPGQATVIHLSGAKTLQALQPHERRASVHPLVSLPNAEVGTDRLRAGATFAVAGHATAETLVAALNGNAVAVAESDRALYHATAAIAANHLVALCAQVERLADSINFPVDRYWDLMASTLENVGRSDSVAALTGPASRGDHATIAQHLQAMDPAERQLYLCLANEAARLAGKSEYRDQSDQR